MKLLTVRDVAELLQVRTETVYRYARQGRIPVIRVGGTWRFPEERLREWMGNGGNGVPPKGPAPPDPLKDPILPVIGIGADGRLTRGLDRALYGRAPR